MNASWSNKKTLMAGPKCYLWHKLARSQVFDDDRLAVGFLEIPATQQAFWHSKKGTRWLSGKGTRSTPYKSSACLHRTVSACHLPGEPTKCSLGWQQSDKWQQRGRDKVCWADIRAIASTHGYRQDRCASISDGCPPFLLQVVTAADDHAHLENAHNGGGERAVVLQEQGVLSFGGAPRCSTIRLETKPAQTSVARKME